MSSLNAPSLISPCAQLALTDLTHLPRVGFRGADSGAWLADRGLTLPQRPNQTVVQGDGSLVARLSQTEYLWLSAPADGGERIAREETQWTPGEAANYLLPRQDSHAWLQLSGEQVSEVMAKLCGVDLRPAAFAVGSVAQTSVARLNCIVINVGSLVEQRFYLLCDRPSLEYFKGALEDAMGEFQSAATPL